MGTTDNHDLPAASTLGETDTYPTINASTSRGADVTGAQLRRFAAGGLVSATASTLAASSATHAGRTVALNRSGGITVTLPAATGTGDRYRFVVGTVSTTGYVIQVTTDDVMQGQIVAASTGETPDLAQPWVTAADSDTVTLNGTTKGGVSKGDFVEFQDIATDTWTVYGAVTASGTEVTPFSAAVS